MAQGQNRDTEIQLGPGGKSFGAGSGGWGRGSSGPSTGSPAPRDQDRGSRYGVVTALRH